MSMRALSKWSFLKAMSMRALLKWSSCKVSCHKLETPSVQKYGTSCFGDVFFQGRLGPHRAQMGPWDRINLVPLEEGSFKYFETQSEPYTPRSRWSPVLWLNPPPTDAVETDTALRLNLPPVLGEVGSV